MIWILTLLGLVVIGVPLAAAVAKCMMEPFPWV